MSDEEQELIQEEAVSEQPAGEHQDEQQEPNQKMVPLAAMLATRRKLQDMEMRAQRAEAASQAYQDAISRKDDVNQPDEDPNALVERKYLQETTALTKREILEAVFTDNNPEAVQKINMYLKPILDKKPWLAASVDTALNRYARAYEIVQDYMHLVEDKPVAKPTAKTDAQRIIQNSRKPGSPVDVGKSARPEGTEYLKSIQGKKEFREYRQKVLRGEA